MSDNSPRVPGGLRPRINMAAAVAFLLVVAAMAVLLLSSSHGYPGGLMAVCAVTAVLAAAALITGIVALKQILGAKEFIVGRGLAIWAVALGGIMLAVMIFVISSGIDRVP